MVTSMPATVRKATKDDAYEVCELLSRSTLRSRSIPMEVRRPMFDHIWGGTEDYCGYVLEDGRIVGFLGMLFTTRPVNGATHKFCEVHSWYVEDAYRNESISLFIPLLSLKGFTLLNYTPTKSVYDISVKFGFQDLESKLRIVYPIPSLDVARRRFELSSARHEVFGHLSGEDKRIFNDHADLQCTHTVVRRRDTGESCYFLWKKMRKRWFEPLGRILYVGNKRLFLEALPFLRTHLCFRHGLQFLVLNHVDFCDASIPFSRVIAREVPSLIRSKTLLADQVAPLHTLPLLIGYALH